MKSMLVDERPDPIAVAAALSCRTRYEMLRAVTETARTVGELAALLGIRQATASTHVSKLLHARLVEVTPDGNKHLVRALVTSVQFVL